VACLLFFGDFILSLSKDSLGNQKRAHLVVKRLPDGLEKIFSNKILQAIGTAPA
jgi:hypothetical protein